MSQQYMPGNRRAVKYEPGNPILEYVRQPVWDRKRITAAATTASLTFFKTFLGGTLRDTNMTSDGSFAAPHTYDAFGLSMFIQQGTVAADLQILMNESFLELRLSSKPYLQAMGFMMPAAGGLYGFTTAVNQFQAQNGLPGPSVYLPLDLEGLPLHLPSQQDFNALLTVANTAAVAFSANVDIWMVLHGIMGRPTM